MAKSTPMDHAVIAGLGNIYADEALFQSGIHSRARLHKLSDDNLRALHRSMRRVLRTSIRHLADPRKLPRSYLIHYRGEGEKCPRCDGEIARIKISQRSTHFCPVCQRAT